MLFSHQQHYFTLGIEVIQALFSIYEPFRETVPGNEGRMKARTYNLHRLP